MKTEKVLLSQVKVNSANPRTITERKLALLVERLLSFPKMIEIRPVVVDEKMIALGGNMRLRAFSRIAQMPLDDIAKTLAGTKNYQRLSKAEQEALLAAWQSWLEKPTLQIVKASSLSEAEKKEFIIADNASFGEWDFDKLANEWDAEDLCSWGVDVWQPEKTTFGGGGSPAALTGTLAVEEDEDTFDPSALPAELQGEDINPDDLPKIEGSNETAMERIIIVFPKSRAEEVAQLVGLPSIDKVVYNIDELLPSETAEEG
jgi:hypothetical protein